VLTSRCALQRTDYGKRIKPGDSIERKLRELAKVRTEEGYMAEVRNQEDGSFLLVENHCPICAAANACQGFCSTELDLFRSVLGPGVSVERAEHIIKGDQRCVYRVREDVSRKGAK
jgi:predicted ArsR family transcriptional regulator